MNHHNLTYILGEPFILSTLAQYITTVDLLRIIPHCGYSRDNLNLFWGHLNKAVSINPRYAYISNTLISDSFFHFLCTSFSECVGILNSLSSSKVVIPRIRLSVAKIHNFKELIDTLVNASQFSHLSEDIMLTQLRFESTAEPNEGEIVEYSNSVQVPGGTIRLFKRAVTALYPGNPVDGTSFVVGIDLDTPKLWLCRVASISNARLDLKAGAMRSDVLRVSNGSKTGTWTDLFPVSGHSAISDPENLYIVEYMRNFSI